MDGIKELDRKEESEVLSLEESLRRDDMDGDKALNPNEYTIAFFKHCWDTVEGNKLHPRVYHSL